MKKALLLSIIALFMQPITASTEVTFFDPKDVDSNGWLWFDTQEKINRYVGITDDIYKVRLCNAPGFHFAFGNG